MSREIQVTTRQTPARSDNALIERWRRATDILIRVEERQRRRNQYRRHDQAP